MGYECRQFYDASGRLEQMASGPVDSPVIYLPALGVPRARRLDTHVAAPPHRQGSHGMHESALHECLPGIQSSRGALAARWPHSSLCRLRRWPYVRRKVGKILAYTRERWGTNIRNNQIGRWYGRNWERSRIWHSLNSGEDDRRFVSFLRSSGSYPNLITNYPARLIQCHWANNFVDE